MKVPLRFQVTEFDCGSVSLLNAFSYLFDRDEIPAELVRTVYLYTLDCRDEKGNIGARGTSREAINKLSNWISGYANSHNFNVYCERLEKEEVTLDRMRECLANKGCVFARCWQTYEHYIIITKIDKKFAYIFDSYYLDKKYYDKDKEVKTILNNPFSYNRKVTLKRLFSETKKDFSLGKIEMRECVLIKRK